MFTPLLPISITSIYGGKPLPARMAKCTPDTFMAIRAVKQEVQSSGADLVLSDLFRSYDMQLQSYLDYSSGRKAAFSPPPGGSMHEAGRSFDLELKEIKKLTLKKFWDIAATHGLTPVIDKPDNTVSEAWHFDCHGSHSRVYAYYKSRKGDNFKKPYTAMAASAIVSIGQKVDALGNDPLPAYIQSGLIRLGMIIGDLDGKIASKTRTALNQLGIDDKRPIDEIADAIDRKLQEQFPQEFFVQGAYIASGDAPSFLFAPESAALDASFAFGVAGIAYQPNPLSLPLLGSITAKLPGATTIPASFERNPKFIGRLPQGIIYMDSELQLDTDGWPEGKGKGDKTWQKSTSWSYKGGGYINANTVPYFVLPKGGWDKKYGVSLGDYAAIIFKDKIAFAVFADRGDETRLGEGSLQLLRALGEERLRPDKTVINSGMGPGVVTIIFPGSGREKRFANEKSLLDAIGEDGPPLFTNLGGDLT